MGEHVFQASVIDELKAAGAHVTNHEMDATPGVPDLSIGYRGRTYWLELKAARTYASLEIRAEQELWMVERGESAGCVGLLALVKDERRLFDWRAVPLVRRGHPAARLDQISVRVPEGTLRHLLVRELR